MKIQILSDESWLGGASIANHKIKDELESRGHNVVIHTINKDEDTWNADMSADLYIVANWAYINRTDLKQLFSNKLVVKFYHDIPGFMYQPKTIFHKEHYDFMQFMVDNAKLNIFISPLQVSVYGNYINLKGDNILVIPPPKDMDGFKVGYGKRKENSCLYLGDISEARGITQSLQIAKQNGWTITFIGPWVNQKLVDKLQADGHAVYKEINNSEVPACMNLYENFIYLPNLIDSFCFKIVEAELCGCQIISDNFRIGRYYYHKTAEELKKMIEESPKIIANKVEEIGTNK